MRLAEWIMPGGAVVEEVTLLSILGAALRVLGECLHDRIIFGRLAKSLEVILDVVKPAVYLPQPGVKGLDVSSNWASIT